MKSSLFQAADDSRASSLLRPEKRILRVAQNDRIGIIGVALKSAVALIGSLVLAPTLVCAQVVSEPDARVPAVGPNTVVAAKRLSDWLLEQTASADDYPLGLSWRVPGEVVTQSQLRLDLLKSLSGPDRGVKADSEALDRLRDWVSRLPVTGRVRVAVADARWLQANPTRDPVLQPGDTVAMPKRPRTVNLNLRFRALMPDRWFQRFLIIMGVAGSMKSWYGREKK